MSDPANEVPVYYSGPCLDGPLQGQVITMTTPRVRVPIQTSRMDEYGRMVFDSVMYRWVEEGWVSTIH